VHCSQPERDQSNRHLVSVPVSSTEHSLCYEH